ncbi:hypothetical protein GCM10011362_34710 [Marinobacter halophilus]|uniref:Glycosyl transferase family 1 domain-containing protein n=1 Tax=Marinobacter halophilus TaxID=1323740 RepID=A0A2T1KG62_9GAMM|nr:hypothetical protein C7H08_05790 [Marinobacter halophilus]GGC83343.1 hypothetical protein GCM10011362_34710 [Marinobacter halophilus]
MSQFAVGDNDKPIIHLVVVELHHHSELIRNIVDVLGNGAFRISIVTLPGIYKDTGLTGADDKAFTAHLKPPKESVGSFILRMASVFESADILYFNTIRHFWDELAQIKSSAPSIVRVHNAHCDLAPFEHFDKPLLNVFGIISHLVRKVWIGGEWRSKKKLLRKIDYFMFPNLAVTDYVKNNKWLLSHRVLPPVLPFGFLGEACPAIAKGDGEVRIAITGKVTNAKKDFDLVYRALKECLGQLNKPVRLVLLGKAADKQAQSVIAKLKSLDDTKFSLDYSESYVPAEVFEEKVRGVDFLVAPIQVDTHFRKYHEVYGKSKASGVDVDILLYRKPSLVISGYQMRGALDSVVEYFEPTPSSLAQMLTRWVNERTFEQLADKFQYLHGYQRDAISNDFYQLCQDLIQSRKSS